MQKIIAILFAVLLQSLYAQPNYLDSLRNTLTTPPGVELKFEIHQTMQGETWAGSGTIEIIGSNRYLAVIGDQEIKVDGTFVQTWNKSTAQLIKDTLYQGNVNIISLLNDSSANLTVLNQDVKNGEVHISFSVPDMDAKGTIQINEHTFSPKSLTLYNGPEAKTEMTILSTKQIGKNSKFHSFSPQVKDTIDLRE